MTAHKVIEAMIHLREQDDYYSRPLGTSKDQDDEEPTGLFGRITAWLTRKFSLFNYEHDDPDCSDGIDWMKLPMGSGMGTAESYSKLSGYYWSRAPSEGASMAMLQHYGAPSGTLDVSFDRCVALWFACHVYDAKNGHAFYRPNDRPGVVYVMQVPDEHLIDIRGGEKVEFDEGEKTIPIAGLRGWRQHGGLVHGATRDDRDLIKYVIKKITVMPGTFDQNDDRLRLLNQQWLFPSPEEDGFYRELLNAKDSDDTATRKLVSYIPLYVAE
jgi:FRG domain